MPEITAETVPSTKPTRKPRVKKVAEVETSVVVETPKVKKPRKSRKLHSLVKLLHYKEAYESKLESLRADANPEYAEYLKSRLAEIDKQIKEKKYLKE